MSDGVILTKRSYPQKAHIMRTITRTNHGLCYNCKSPCGEFYRCKRCRKMVYDACKARRALDKAGSA